jgi:hypothetical protein
MAVEFVLLLAVAGSVGFARPVGIGCIVAR